MCQIQLGQLITFFYFKLYRFCALYYWSKILFQLFFFLVL